jgi:hypothetical protein
MPLIPWWRDYYVSPSMMGNLLCLPFTDGGLLYPSFTDGGTIYLSFNDGGLLRLSFNDADSCLSDLAPYIQVMRHAYPGQLSQWSSTIYTSDATGLPRTVVSVI